MKNGKRVVIKTNQRERFIGYIDKKKKTFSKDVYISRHLFRKLDAWGLDANYFNKVLLPENYKIIVSEKEGKIRYEINAKEFKKNCIYLHFNKYEDNRSQVFLPREFWKKIDTTKGLNQEQLAKLGVFG